MFNKNKKSENNTTRRFVKVLPEHSKVFSYHANRKPSDASNSKRHTTSQVPSKPRPGGWWKQIPMLLAGIVILVCIVDALLLSADPRVVVLGTTSDQLFLRSSTTYERAAQQLLSHSVFNRNKLTVNTSGVTQQLKQQFPELADASITLPLLGHRPVLYVEPETPTLILATQNEKTYIISNSGKAVIAVSDLVDPTSLQLPTIVDQSGLVVSVGEATLPSSSVDFIHTVIQQLKAQQIATAVLDLPKGGSEFDVHLAGRSYFVKFNLKSDVDQQIGTFVAVNNYLNTHNVTPLQYIDVRVPGRAYYK